MTQDSPARLPVADWNLLFDAVTYRLRHEVHDACETSSSAQLALLDCAHALDLLRGALVQERRVAASLALCALPNRQHACDAAMLPLGNAGGSGGTLNRRLV